MKLAVSSVTLVKDALCFCFLQLMKDLLVHVLSSVLPVTCPCHSLHSADEDAAFPVGQLFAMVSRDEGKRRANCRAVVPKVGSQDQQCLVRNVTLLIQKPSSEAPARLRALLAKAWSGVGSRQSYSCCLECEFNLEERGRHMPSR